MLESTVVGLGTSAAVLMFFYLWMWIRAYRAKKHGWVAIYKQSIGVRLMFTIGILIMGMITTVVVAHFSYVEGKNALLVGSGATLLIVISWCLPMHTIYKYPKKSSSASSKS